MRVYDALADALHMRGTDQVFGLMGTELARFILALRDRGISYSGARQETGCVGMADGYSAVTGKVGVAIVSQGPGFSNALTSLRVAGRRNSRVLLVAASAAVGLEDPSIAIAETHSRKYVDQMALAEAAGIQSVTLSDPMAAVADLDALFARAEQGFTVVANIPTDVLNAEAGAARSQVTLTGEVRQLLPDKSVIVAVADLLESGAASRPVILAGRGAVRAKAEVSLRRLGALVGAIVGTTLPARSFFEGEQYCVGIVGGFSSPLATRLLRDSDLVLSFGASLNHLTTGGGLLFRNACIIQFDNDPNAYGRFVVPQIAVLGDVRLAAESLCTELERRGFEQRGYRDADETSDLPVPSVRSDIDDQGESARLDPRAVLIELDRLLPKDRTVVVDAGQHMAFETEYLGVTEPARWIWPLDYAAIGIGLGIAIGAAIGDPHRPTVLGIGDSGLLMSLGDLDTLARLRLRLLVIVMNDAAHGGELQQLRLAGLPEDLAVFPERSFADIAQTFGIQSRVLRSIEDLELLANELSSLQGPLLLDCRITTTVKADFITNWHQLTKPRPMPKQADQTI